jgi:MYXO-CTERM domain-containing protein
MDENERVRLKRPMLRQSVRWLREAVTAVVAIGVAASCGAVDDGSIGVEPAAARADAGPALSPLGSVIGQACTKNWECESGFCVDGVCCSSACSGACQGCSAATKGSGENGTCGFRALGQSPKGGYCEVPAMNSCGASTCNGFGVCGRKEDTVCGAKYCSGSELCATTCGKDAQCETHDCSQCANGFTCDSAQRTCFTACTTHDQCQEKHFCRQGTCAKKYEDGKPCTEKAQCQTGHCYVSKNPDQKMGLCCATGCETPCWTCFASEQQGPEPKDGICQPTKVFENFNGDCVKAPEACGAPGWCSGNGACATQAPEGDKCGDTTCIMENNAPYVTGLWCKGGACQGDPLVKTACEGVANCDGDTCVDGCTGDADCLSTHYCQLNLTKCVLRSPDGDSCNSDSECSSTHCVDGYCCAGACSDQCEACDVPGNLGSCIAVKGEPRGAKREPCPGAGGSQQPCLARACDGKTRTTCEGFVGSETECSPPSCTTGPYGSTYQPEGTCDGASKCVQPDAIPCGAATCESCFEPCTVETEAEDCVPSARCIEGNCVLAKTCLDRAQLRLGNGETVSCDPYACRNDDCLKECSSNEDCAAGAVCDAKARACVVPAGAQDDPGDPGCGCRVAPRGSPIPWWTLSGLLGLALLRRRRA